MIDKKLKSGVEEEVERLQSFLSVCDKVTDKSKKKKVENKFCDIIICLSDINNFLEILWYNNNL